MNKSIKIVLANLLILLTVCFVLNPTSTFAFSPNLKADTDVSLPPAKIEINNGTGISGTAMGDKQTYQIGTAAALFDSNEDPISGLFNPLFARGNLALGVVAGIVALTMIGVLIKQFVELGASADNSQKRSGALNGILWSCIAIAISGSVTLFMALAYNLFI